MDQREWKEKIKRRQSKGMQFKMFKMSCVHGSIWKLENFNSKKEAL